MLNYYKILDIPHSADEHVIRAAYKKLALQYHPDRNPGNQAAEEYFKVVNEAHQVLSDPNKKAQYDVLLFYVYQSPTQVTNPSQQGDQRQWNTHRHTRGNWRYAAHRPSAYYKVDKNYFKAQVLTLLSVMMVAVIVLLIYRSAEYFEIHKEQVLQAKNEQVLAQARQLYHEGHYRKAFDIVIQLISNHPVESKFSEEKSTMVANLSHHAVSFFTNREYQKAIDHLEIVRDYEQPMRLETWRMMAECYYQLAQYQRAIHALEYILIRDKGNVELMMKIGDIYFDHLGLYSKAQEYYTAAKYEFKDLQSSIYGKAFELVMPVDKVPEIYIRMFSRRGEINMAIENYEEAITDYNWVIYLRPQTSSAYHLRALCRYKTGDPSRACRDWQQAMALGEEDSKSYLTAYCR